MLMGANDGAVEHRVFIVGIGGQMLKYPLPDTGFGPTAEAPVHVDAIAEAFGQIAPWHASPIAVENRFDEQPIVRCRDPDSALASGQQVLDPLPLVVA
jgi:hypothetical protein